MKNKFPIIFAIISFLILMTLIVAGLLSGNDISDRGRKLFTQKDLTDTAYVSESAPEVSTEATPENIPSDTLSSDAESTMDISGSIVSKPSLSENSPLDDTDSPSAGESRKVLAKYNDVLKINPYVSGWLTIEGLGLDEPVVYTPNSQNYFLHRALDGTEQERGSLFIAVNWREGYNNTLIYGHNMKDGTSFGALSKYEDESFGRSHTKMRFDTLYDENEYELVAVFLSQIEEEELETEEDREAEDKEIMEESIEKKQEEIDESGDETAEPVDETQISLADLNLSSDMGDIDIYRVEKDTDDDRFRYYYFTDLSEKKDFDYFAEHVKANALYDTGVDIEWGDELLTMSTCNYHVKNGRLIVVAKKVK